MEKNIEKKAELAKKTALWSRPIVRLIAVLLIELVILLPFHMVYALRITPATPPHAAVGFNQATIQWQTDVPSTGRVEYGALGSLSTIVESNALQTSHAAQLSSLDSEHTYYYRIVAIDEGGQVVTEDNFGANYQFTTAKAPDLSIPIISNVKIEEVTPSTATISWDTDKAASTKVYYGEKTPLNLTSVLPGYVLHHSTVLQVNDKTRYTYIVNSCSVASVCANSSEAAIVSGSEEQPFINISIPQFVNSKRMDIAGTTKKNSAVDVFVKGTLFRSVKSDNEGKFQIAGLTLAEGSSLVRLEITDQIGTKLEKDYNITVDTRPPVLNITNVPEVATSTGLTINGTVDEFVSLTFRVVNKKDQEAPAKITGLKQGSVFTNTVEISWDKSIEKDVKEYIIYRDGTRITTTRSPSFRDAGAFVDSGKTYQYQISAIDDSCNEGQKSEILSVKTESGGPVYNRTGTSFNLSCSIFKESSKLGISGDFFQPINLGTGENNCS